MSVSNKCLTLRAVVCNFSHTLSILIQCFLYTPRSLQIMDLDGFSGALSQENMSIMFACTKNIPYI